MSSPTQRTLAEMRKRGYELVDVVERWLPWVKQRKDLFGIGDVMAVGTPGVAIVQTTSGSNLAARVKKLTDSAALPHLRAAGIKILAHGWRKNSKGRYELREVDLS